MKAKQDILKIVKEDALRIIGEKKARKVSLKTIKSEIKASNLFVSQTIEELRKEDFIRFQKDCLLLTKKRARYCKGYY